MRASNGCLHNDTSRLTVRLDGKKKIAQWFCKVETFLGVQQEIFPPYAVFCLDRNVFEGFLFFGSFKICIVESIITSK